MKTILTLLFINISFFANCQFRCVTASKYYVMQNGTMKEHKEQVIACYNDHYFSFRVGNDIKTFEIEEQTHSKTLNENKVDESFMNVNSQFENRGSISVDIIQGDKIEVTINYPNVQGGFAYYFYNKTWTDDNNNSKYFIESMKRNEIKKDSLKKIKNTENEEMKTSEKLATKSKEEIYTVVEVMPEFPGGATEMMKYIQKNIQYPQMAKEAGLSGKCFLKFVVNGSGNTSDVTVLKGIPGCEECDQEAIRLIKAMPKWKCGTQSGKPVSVFFNLPINFQIR